MNKKILIGVIIAVVILVLVSFTGVVGYQTTSNAIARASPLFSIRSSRAIDEESKDIACDYIGKGEETNIHLTSRIKKTEQVQKAVDIIGKMDDKAFSRFVARIIPLLKNKEKMTDKVTSDMLQALHRIRENPNVLKYYDTKDIPIVETGWIISCFWFPGCNILLFFIFTLNAIIDFITSKLTCDTPCKTVATGWPCC